MANVKKFLFIDSTGQQKEQTALDTLQVADGVNASDVVNKGQLDAVASTASGAVSAEETRALAAEAALQLAIDGVAGDLVTETSRATAAENAIAADLAQEITDRSNAITSLNNSLSQSILDEKTRAEVAEAAIAGDLLDEVSRAQTAENGLQGQITQEVTDRQTAITSLSGTLSAAITTEEQARISADDALDGRIDTEISDREAAITTVTDLINDEESRAMAAEGVLTSAISQEVSDRQAAVSAEQARAELAEGQIASDLAGEITDRVAAVSAEQARAEAAEAQLSTDLATETQARIDGDAATLSTAKAYADGLVSGVTFKNSVRVALPWQFEMGPDGAKVTYTLPADFASIAGAVGLDAGDRVLLINKDDGSTSVSEGIYVVAAGGMSLVRAPDMAAGSDASGVLTYVEEGVMGSDLPFATPGTSFVCAAIKGSDVVGTDALDFAVFSRAEALQFTKGTKKEGLDVSLSFASGAPFVQDDGLDIVIDSAYFKKDAGSLTMQGALVGGGASSADHLHIHKHAAVVKPCSVSAGFVKPDMTGATWNSPAVMGLVEMDAPSAGEKVIVVAGLGGAALASDALAGFSVGDVIYLGGVSGEFAAFADVPSGKYAVPVGRKVAAKEIVVQIGGAPTLKA
jgi:hypothetical protein